MKKSTKTLSAAVAVASLGNLVVPAVTAFAAEQNTTDVEALVKKAETTVKGKGMYKAWFEANEAVTKAGQGSKYAKRLSAVYEAIPYKDTLKQIVDGYMALSNPEDRTAREYYRLEALVNTLNDQDQWDRDFIGHEVYVWADTILKGDYKAVDDAVMITLPDLKAKEDYEGMAKVLTEVQKTVDKLTGDNKVYAAEQLKPFQDLVKEKLTAKVESVSAINSNQIEVTFSKEVKADSVKPADFKVTDKDGNLLFVSKAEVKSTDAKTVVLSFFDTFADKATYTVETSNVADKNGNVIATSSNSFAYVKADVATVAFTQTTVKPNANLADYVKVTDKLGRDVTAEQKSNIKFESADKTIINENGQAIGVDGTSALVSIVVGDTKVTTKAVIKISTSEAKTFAGYTLGTSSNLPTTTEEYNKLTSDKISTSLSINDSEIKLGFYTLDQYGKSQDKTVTFDKVENLTPNVAIVNADGSIIPISVGTAYAKVTIGDVTKTVEINVKEVSKITNFNVDNSDVNVVENGLTENVKLTYLSQFGNETTGVKSNLSVKSSDEKVATVAIKDTNNVEITGVKSGTAKVTLTYKYADAKTNKDVTLTKEINVTVSAKGNFADYKVEVDKTKLFSEDDTNTANVDERTAAIKVYQLDDKGQKIALLDPTKTTIKALDKDGKEITAATKVTINDSQDTVSFLADGTETLVVKVGDYVADTITFTSVNNTPGVAANVIFDNNAVVVGEFDSSATETNDLQKQLAKIVTLKDKFGDKLNADNVAAGTIKFTYKVTNINGITFDGTSAKVTGIEGTKLGTADIVVTGVTFTPSVGAESENLLTNPQVVKLSVKDTTAPEVTDVEDNKVDYDTSTGVTPVCTESGVTVKLTKDGSVVSTYTALAKISDVGKYVLTVTDKCGNATVYNFTIA